MIPVGPLVRVVHGPLLHISFDRANLAIVVARDDCHPVAAASHTVHRLEGRLVSSGARRGLCLRIILGYGPACLWRWVKVESTIGHLQEIAG